MRIRQIISDLDVMFSQRACSFTREGLPLSAVDSLTIKEVYQQWILLLIDLGYLDLDRRRAIAGRLVSDLCDRDIMIVLNSQAELYNLCQIKSSIGFEALCHKISPHLYNLLKDDVKSMDSACTASARRLIQVFTWCSRISLRDVDLLDQCLTGYIDTENSITEPLCSSVIKSLRRIIKRWVRAFDPNEFRFSHGPGAVAGLGSTTLENKYRNLSSDALVEHVFRNPGYMYVNTYDPSPAVVRSSLDRISQTIFVPKSYKTFRVISMEPPTLMYLQQGVWGEIDRIVQKHRYLNRRIGFHEQGRNQDLAREGSLYRNYSTIDLSAASDSVSWWLVKELFKDTNLYPYLLATRSTRTLLPDGRLLKLKKFAPMGSALCFPIETIIFASICELVTQRWAYNKQDCRERSFAGDFSVFGDDIIVPTECASDTISVLGMLGFSVNQDKSFVDESCWYRESCGGEYCDGTDVTPIRISRRYSSDLDAVSVSGCVDMANSAFEKGFLTLRSFFLKKLRDAKFVPLFGDSAVLSYDNTNYHTKTRHNRDYQRPEALVSVILPDWKKNKGQRKGDNAIALRHWFESTRDRDSGLDVDFESNVGSIAPLKHFKTFVPTFSRLSANERTLSGTRKTLNWI